MSKKNYRAMYNKTDAPIPESTSIAPVEEIIEEVVAETPVEVPVEESKCEFVVGTVVGCSRLNVRKEPTTIAEVICTVPVWSEVQICTIHDHDLWYHIYTAAGQEGYCMKQFIEIK